MVILMYLNYATTFASKIIRLYLNSIFNIYNGSISLDARFMMEVTFKLYCSPKFMVEVLGPLHCHEMPK